MFINFINLSRAGVGFALALYMSNVAYAASMGRVQGNYLQRESQLTPLTDQQIMFGFEKCRNLVSSATDGSGAGVVILPSECFDTENSKFQNIDYQQSALCAVHYTGWFGGEGSTRYGVCSWTVHTYEPGLFLRLYNWISGETAELNRERRNAAECSKSDRSTRPAICNSHRGSTVIP